MQKGGKKGSKLKNKTTFIYETFKVQNVKVVLFFTFLAILVTFWTFFEFYLKKLKIAKIWSKKAQIQKIRPLLFIKLKKFKL